MSFETVYSDLFQGVKTDVSFDEDTNEVVTTYHGFNDIQLENNKQMQNETSDWRKFDAKQELHPVLDLTMVDAMILKDKHDIDLFGAVDYNELFRVIEKYYPYMKTTTARLI